MGKFKEIEIANYDKNADGQLAQLNFMGLIDLIKNFSVTNEMAESNAYHESEKIETVSEDQLALGLCL